MTDPTPESAAPTLLSPDEVLEALAEDPTALEVIAKHQRLAAAALKPEPRAGVEESTPDQQRISQALLWINVRLEVLSDPPPETLSDNIWRMFRREEIHRLEHLRRILRGEK